MDARRGRRSNEGFYTKEKKRRRRNRREEKRKTTNIVFCNIAGVSTLSSETWEEIKKCEIIGLTETWLEAKNKKILERHLKGYNWETIAVKRIKKRGRARGGMLLAIRKEIETVRQEREEERENGEKEILMKTIKIEGKEIRIISTYMRERRRENWSCLEEEAEKTKGIPS